MMAVANVPVVRSDSVTGIQWVLFLNGSMAVATASYPDFDVGNLVLKSMLTRSARSNGVGNTCRSPYGFAFLCLTR